MDSMGGSALYTVGYIALMVFLFYFLLIRPQQRIQKKRNDMMSNMKVDDKVVTVGGIVGIVTEIMSDSVWLEVSDGVDIEVKKSGIAAVVNDGEENSAE